MYLLLFTFKLWQFDTLYCQVFRDAPRFACHFTVRQEFKTINALWMDKIHQRFSNKWMKDYTADKKHHYCNVFVRFDTVITIAYNLKYICIHFTSNSSIFPEITLEFSGCANVHWSEHKTGKKGERKRREHYRAREEYFNQSTVLVQKGRLKPIFGTILLLIAHQNLSLNNINTLKVFFQFRSINYDACNDNVQNGIK